MARDLSGMASQGGPALSPPPRAGLQPSSLSSGSPPAHRRPYRPEVKPISSPQAPEGSSPGPEAGLPLTIFSLAHWTEAARVTQGQQGLSSGPSPGCGGTIHLAQLPPSKPHSVAASIPREAAEVASDMETESVLLKRQGDPWASWTRPPCVCVCVCVCVCWGGGDRGAPGLCTCRVLRQRHLAPSAWLTPVLRYLLWKCLLPSSLRLGYSLWTPLSWLTVPRVHFVWFIPESPALPPGGTQHMLAG